MQQFSLFLMFIACTALSQWTTVSAKRARKFPEGFLFGTATASYQIEGAWNVDGKSENIWDHFTHKHPEMIKDNSNGDNATNSYYLYERDVEMVRELGIDFYRFSISWTRILPTGFPDEINLKGVEYYNKLINELLKYNIKPIITIYHWDLPQKLQKLGGWTNPEIVTWFTDYARVVFKLFGDRVKNWITINEPHQICYYGYGLPLFAPAVNIKGVAEYLCSKNLLVAHANAYRIYNEEFRHYQKGIIFISLSAQWYEPESKDQIDAAFAANQFYWAQYSHPIFSKDGDYPPIMKKRIAAKSAKQGFPRSRLPEFTPEEIKLIQGSSDFFGLNHYSTYYTYRNESTYGSFEVPSLEDDLEVTSYTLPEWRIGESNFTLFVPEGFYKLLTQIRKDYNNPPVIISENGFATKGGIVDKDRVTYYRAYLNAMLDAIDEGSDIRAYTAWSLMDNFEWSAGYTECFGLYQVNFTDPKTPRTPRLSAYVYKEIVRTRALDQQYKPDLSQPLTIDKGN